MLDAQGRQGVEDGVHDGGHRADGAGLAGALDAEGLVSVGTGLAATKMSLISPALGMQ